jgi:hypothetical protein
MSKVAITGNASGTGTFTLASPNSNSDRTLDLPDAGGTVFVSGQAVTATTGNFSGNVTLGSSVLATPTGSAPAYLCRAWVNFNGTGTVAIRASGNVSSITDSGVGLYQVNFTTAMPDANYAIVSTSRDSGVRPTVSSAATTSASQAFVNTLDSSFVSYDANTILVAIFR